MRQNDGALRLAVVALLVVAVPEVAFSAEFSCPQKSVWGASLVRADVIQIDKDSSSYVLEPSTFEVAPGRFSSVWQETPSTGAFFQLSCVYADDSSVKMTTPVGRPVYCTFDFTAESKGQIAKVIRATCLQKPPEKPA